MATLAEINKRKAKAQAAEEARLTPQFPDIQEVAKLVPQGRELIPGFTSLASDIEQSGLQRQGIIAETAQPGVRQAFDTAGGQIQQFLQGQVPQDVIDRLQSNVAARALSGGVPGSGFAGNQFARTLGLTSLDMISRGIGSLMGITPVAQETFGVEPVDIAADVPGTTDIFNQLLGQELARSQVGLTFKGLNAARAGASTGASVPSAGGGGGGGYFETTPVGYGGFGLG